MSNNIATLGQAKHTLELVSSLSGSQMITLHSGYLSDLVEAMHNVPGQYHAPSRDAMRVSLGLLPLSPTLIVDYDLPLQKAIMLGNYDRVFRGLYKDDLLREWLSENPPVLSGRKKVLVRLEVVASSTNLQKNDAEEQCTAPGFTLASYQELLAFGAVYPEVQKRYGIIFGKSYEGPSSFKVHHFQPNLSYDGENGRCLSLEPGGTYSSRHTTFLFVKR